MSSTIRTSEAAKSNKKKDIFLIIYYPFSDPGKAYEICRLKDLEETWITLDKGVEVSVKYGKARTQGIVVSKSDNREELRQNFDAITEAHRQEEVLKDCVATLAQFKANEQLSAPRRSMEPLCVAPESIHQQVCVQEQGIKLVEKGTQTEPRDAVMEEPSSRSYSDLKQECKKLKDELEKYKSLFADVTIVLNGAKSKLQIANSFINDNNASTSSSSSSSTISNNNKKRALKERNENIETSNEEIQIGRRGTKITRVAYDSINWNSYTSVTRRLLTAIFPREILATHSLTGKPSPAFLKSDKVTKSRLDQAVVSDIVEFVSSHCKVSESQVRNAITTKCADENKLYKKRKEKQQSSTKFDEGDMDCGDL